MASKQQIRKDMRAMQTEIYRKLVNYLIGPKWTFSKYKIDTMHKNTNDDIIIIDGGYMRPKCSVYIGYSIRIGASIDNVSFVFKRWYNYFGHDAYVMPEDSEDYIYVTTEFLKEFFKHVISMDVYADRYPKYLRDAVDADMWQILQDHNISYYEEILAYEFNYERDRDFMIALTQMFKSKKFKRARDGS